ncbi:HD domain-containing protein [Salipiger sp. P9]|uniref:HD domain-containing protein n=1 Tax=Salipiger pentaromativorans TaxID=2943193 RepID=UPI0021574292|nr:HD domain-containing protein [Salipiger pentaromativorans]MCR8547061.1 HD domain-containing protein [Salipiger pentaromativorans]
MEPDRHDRILAFMAKAERLKATFRSGQTSAGRPESVAEHSWSLCLLALLTEPESGVDIAQLLRLCIVHDLGEAISGDVPAIHQSPEDDKTARERADLATLTEILPDDLRSRLRALWEEYEAGESPEARMAKGLDKLETMMQHLTGPQHAAFDYGWNLGYGTKWTATTDLLRSLRTKVDARTRNAAS